MRTDAPRQSRWTGRYGRSNCRTDQTRPSAFAGQWEIVGINGELRGTATLASDGSVDTNDDYTGVWTVDDSAVHVVMWKKRPHETTGNFTTTPDVQSLRIQQSARGQVALSGEHVVLRRSPDENS